MTSSLNIWKSAIRQARSSAPFTGRLKRKCHEIEDFCIKFDNLDDTLSPLQVVRKLGWYYPSDEELTSIILGSQDQHIYSFSQKITDQLPQIVALLATNPETRRAVLQLVSDDDMDLGDTHVPCLMSVNFRIRNGKLHVTVHSRSSDLLVGLPANLFQMTILAKEVAKMLDVETGSLSFFINSAHVFSDYELELAQVLNE